MSVLGVSIAGIVVLLVLATDVCHRDGCSDLWLACTEVCGQYYSMRLSNEVDHSDPVNLLSLGVVDLDNAIMPDVFGLRAFDFEKPITRMSPGQFRNEFPGIAPEGFHDVVITELSAILDWRTSWLIPSDVTSLLQRWRRILFRTMHKCQEEMEKLRRSCRDRPEQEFRQGHPGHCPQCHEYVAPALDRHMMNNHLELG